LQDLDQDFTSTQKQDEESKQLIILQQAAANADLNASSSATSDAQGVKQNAALAKVRTLQEVDVS
jgi:uncharacterized protein YeaC (DUF1315 family)